MLSDNNTIFSFFSQVIDFIQQNNRHPKEKDSMMLNISSLIKAPFPDNF
jgi:hypothetical protein